MPMTLEQTEQTMQAYGEALLSHGDFARHFSDQVTCSVEGTDQCYQGRDAVREWIDGAHAVGEVKLRSLVAGAGHAAIEADFIRKDGRVVPYAVAYDLAEGKITALRLYFTGPVA